MKLYNTASRKIENFKPYGEIVKIYTCGPTVYSYAHIGNLTAYIYWDLLIRTLHANNFKTKHVLNLTDVGHLVSDGDEGEDKLEKGARRDRKDVFEVANMYARAFLDDYAELELSQPDVVAKATDYVKQDMAAVDAMTKNGYTYETEDGIYFDSSKYPDYAKFARLDLDGLKAGARIEFSQEKKNPTDFAVWKFIKPGEKHAMRWDYLGRPGYPGWHLECSTIIHEILGEPIDIHTGGIDHIPIHHTNEIAQTYALTGQVLAKYWLHCDFITIDGEKISKSLGNVYNLSDLKERGYSPLDYKMWVLQGHYQGARNFTFDSLEAARVRRLNWRNHIAEARQTDNTDNPDAIKQVIGALSNNLNSAEAFAIIDNSTLSLADWEKIDILLGLELIADAPEIDDAQKELVQKRQEARKVKDYAEADRLRGLLEKHNICVEDRVSGPLWQYIR